MLQVQTTYLFVSSTLITNLQYVIRDAVIRKNPIHSLTMLHLN